MTQDVDVTRQSQHLKLCPCPPVIAETLPAKEFGEKIQVPHVWETSQVGAGDTARRRSVPPFCCISGKGVTEKAVREQKGCPPLWRMMQRVG